MQHPIKLSLGEINDFIRRGMASRGQTMTAAPEFIIDSDQRGDNDAVTGATVYIEVVAVPPKAP